MAAAALEVSVSVRARNWGCWSLRVRFQEEYWEESGKEVSAEQQETSQDLHQAERLIVVCAKHCTVGTSPEQEIHASLNQTCHLICHMSYPCTVQKTNYAISFTTPPASLIFRLHTHCQQGSQAHRKKIHLLGDLGHKARLYNER